MTLITELLNIIRKPQTIQLRLENSLSIITVCEKKKSEKGLISEMNNVDDSINSLNMEQVRNMKPSEIITHFFEENFESEITDKQMEDFLQAFRPLRAP